MATQQQVHSFQRLAELFRINPEEMYTNAQLGGAVPEGKSFYDLSEAEAAELIDTLIETAREAARRAKERVC